MKFKTKTLTTLMGIAGLIHIAGAALPPDYQGLPFDDAAYRAGQQGISGDKTPQRTAFTPVKVLWDGRMSTSGEGWVGKGETAASIVLDPADQEGKRLIHHHNQVGRVNFSTFGWRWAGPEDASVDLRQFDALSFAIKITGPQKPQELFFGINGANPTPVPLRKYDPQFHLLRGGCYIKRFHGLTFRHNDADPEVRPTGNEFCYRPPGASKARSAGYWGQA